MLQKYFLIIILLITTKFFYSCSEEKNNQFQLSGKFYGTNTKQLILAYQNSLNYFVTDTIPIKNGRFFAEGEINGAVRARIQGSIESQSMSDPNVFLFFMEPTKNYISLKENNFQDAIVSGSKTQEEYEVLENSVEPLYSKIDELKSEMIRLRKQKLNEPKNRRLIENTIESIALELEGYREKIKIERLSFLQSHPESYLNPFWLHFYSRGLSMDTLKSLYEKLNPRIKNGLYGIRLRERMELIKKATIGFKAPNFKVEDTYGNRVSLEKFKGKYVLLDFWASWCAPCLENHPILKKLYNQYNKKGLEILGVSIDSDKEVWLQTIQKEGSDTWHHINSWDNEKPINELYNIKPIPAYVLIDKRGSIVGRYLAASTSLNDMDDLKYDLKNLID
ncbi:TlpA disulfide reductase family protein [Flagellimonas onchidii]|uniref:TlpA disulfide reductase family protein n=1 Tax=Flagellimonas onchidii TaxID=2562684 RepID=UPI001455EE7E|nr:TlpA disulfide reductase family protein [Allomuricauda onchidii]